MIIDLFSLDVNQRKCKSLLYRKMSEEAVREEQYAELKELQRYISVFLQNITEKFPFPMTYSQEIPVQELLKAADARFDFEDRNLSETLIDYLSIMRDFGGKSIFFICNLKTWLGEKEIIDFYKDVIYRKLTVVLLENHIGDFLAEMETNRIIDSDLCEIN